LLGNKDRIIGEVSSTIYQGLRKSGKTLLFCFCVEYYCQHKLNRKKKNKKRKK